MKKLISFMILLALSISLFGCAKAPELDSAMPDLLTEDKAQDAEVINPEQPENQPEQTPEQPEQPEKTPGDVPVTDESPVTDEAPVKVEEMAFTKDDKFSSFEVAVLLTEEETNKDKTYTAADFEGYDIFSVVEYNFYPEKYYPEHKGKKGLVLYLNEPSKERVLEYCDKLSKDPRVEVAEPNIDILWMNILQVTLTDQAYADFENMKLSWFSEMDLDYIYKQSGLPKGDVHFFLNSNDEKNTLEQLKKTAHSKYIKSARRYYTERTENFVYVEISHERYMQNQSFSEKEFPELCLKSIGEPIVKNVKYIDGERQWVPEYCVLKLTFNKSTKKIYKIIEKLQKNPIVTSAYMSDNGIAYDIAYDEDNVMQTHIYK